MNITNFLSLVDSSGDGCWEWQGRIDKDGYGRFGRAMAHRVAYKIANPRHNDTLAIDHTCRNRRCCRPSHLEAVTTQENLRRRQF